MTIVKYINNPTLDYRIRFGASNLPAVLARVYQPYYISVHRFTFEKKTGTDFKYHFRNELYRRSPGAIETIGCQSPARNILYIILMRV